VHVEVEFVGHISVSDTAIRPILKCKDPGIRCKTNDALRRIKTKQSTVHVGNLNRHVLNDAVLWKGLIRQDDDAEVNNNKKDAA